MPRHPAVDTLSPQPMVNAMMMTLMSRSYQGTVDLQPITNLLNACEAVDQEGSHYTLSALELEMTEPGSDPEHNCRLWEDPEGHLIAYAQLWVPTVSADPEILDGLLWFRVHPQSRHPAFEREILAWAEARLRQIAQTKAHAGKLQLYSGAREGHRDRIMLLEQSGFTLARCFLTMGRSLLPPIPTPQFPAGFRLGQVGRDASLEAWVEAHNQTFIDHWQFHPLTVEEACHWLQDPHYRPALDLVALAPDGTVAAFCKCRIDPEANTHKNTNEGWVGILGTRRGYRRLGLGRAMLLAGLHVLWEAGVDTAKLAVDTQNPNQAFALYESAGFRKLYARVLLMKDLELAQAVPGNSVQ